MGRALEEGLCPTGDGETTCPPNHEREADLGSAAHRTEAQRVGGSWRQDSRGHRRTGCYGNGSPQLDAGRSWALCSGV